MPGNGFRDPQPPYVGQIRGRDDELRGEEEKRTRERERERERACGWVAGATMSDSRHKSATNVVKVVVIGDSGWVAVLLPVVLGFLDLRRSCARHGVVHSVGKTSLLRQYVNKLFSSHYKVPCPPPAGVGHRPP